MALTPSILPTNRYNDVMLEPDAVLDAIERRFGFVVDKIVRLHGFCDCTYYVKQAGKLANEYIFKVFTDPYTSRKEQVEAEINLIQFLSRNDLPVPKVVPAKNSAYFSQIDFSCGRPSFTRLQTFLKGSLLRDVPLTVDLSRKVGLLVGRIDRTLEKYENPFYKDTFDPEFVITYADNERISVLLPALSDEGGKDMCAEGIRIFVEKVVPSIPSLPTQQIHGDIDCVNIIADPNKIEADGLPALGVIDFTDSRRSCRIYEATCTLCSILAFGRPDSTACAKAFLDAYMSVVPLSQLELNLLRPCVIGRFAQLIIFHEYQAVSDPKYNGYMLKACGPNCYKLLENLLAEEKSAQPASFLN